MRQLPPLGALRAFEAAGRCGNLGMAARELCVTHGAISKQVKSLEASLGIRLTRRGARGIDLTPEGAALLPYLVKAFDDLDAALRSMDRQRFEGSLTIACMPGLAATWLIPKLSLFMDLYPQLALTLLAPEAAAAQGGSRVDLEILYGRPDRASGQVTVLKRLDIFPVCSPRLLEGSGAVTRLADLTRHRLIDNPEGTHWRDFFVSQGMDPGAARHSLRFHDFTHCISAARAGLGVAMGDNVTTAEDLASGALVRPLRDTMRRQSLAYYLVTSPDRPASAAAEAFVSWLLAEIRKTGDG